MNMDSGEFGTTLIYATLIKGEVCCNTNVQNGYYNNDQVFLFAANIAAYCLSPMRTFMLTTPLHTNTRTVFLRASSKRRALVATATRRPTRPLQELCIIVAALF
jgi:hypothetical protein